jgi:hypothetical protein
MNKKIFVFGSNLAGRHGKGAALEAARKHGACYGVAIGPQGNSYAIPTKNSFFEPLPLPTIKNFVSNFLDYARKHPEKEFFVTAIGTGLAGYDHKDIAPFFIDAPKNCELPEEWFVEIAYQKTLKSIDENIDVYKRLADR